MEDKNTNEFLNTITKYDIALYEEHPSSLEAYFMKFYKNEKTFTGVNK